MSRSNQIGLKACEPVRPLRTASTPANDNGHDWEMPTSYLLKVRLSLRALAICGACAAGFFVVWYVTGW